MMHAGWLTLVLAAGSVVHPVFPPGYGPESVEGLKPQVAESMARSPEELMALVPEASGIYFVGCPKCQGGSQESNIFEYSLDLGDTVRCRYCETVLPNEAFPNNRELRITAPSGREQVYRWHEDADGRQYFLEAHAWWHRWRWTQDQAWLLANLHALTGDPAYGDRAAAIVGRYAEVYPDYPVRFDYPYKPKRFFPADQKYPYDDVGPFRGAKFYWWAYGDIPDVLTRTYDLLAAGDAFDRMAPLLGPDIRERIERDLIRMGYAFTVANPDDYTNMSPGMYHDMVVAGRVIGDPEMVHEAVKRFRTLVDRNFFLDGWWIEGAPSYHAQTVGNLLRVADVARGYSDPEGWTPPPGTTPFRDLDLLAEVPRLAQAVRVGEEALLPDGRMIPINDTWWTDRRKPLEAAVSRLWPGLGHAVLGAGTGGTAFQAHLNWSGGYGHAHADNGSLILFAFGKELLSDIGYTHTRYRNWTVNTASHNVVVIDERSQELGSKTIATMGNLLCFDDAHPRVRFVDVDASPAYPGATVYRRRLVHVHVGEGRDYVVDVFDIEGGRRHDWFLHGSADEEGVFNSSLPIETAVESLVPDWGGRGEYRSELDLDVSGERFHAYDFLWEVKSAPATGPWTATWHYQGIGLRAHLFPPAGATLYRFASPAVRGARDQDALLHQHLRRGILQRHDGGQSRFVAVYEPYAETPWIEDVTLDDTICTVRHGGGEERVVFTDDRVAVESTAGWDATVCAGMGGEGGGVGPP